MTAAFKLKAFAGLSPRTGRAILQDNEAQIANNVRLYSGEIRAWSGYSDETPAPEIDFHARSIFRAYGTNAGYQWFAWPTDVDAVDGPVYDIHDFRVYYTGDGVPKKTNSTLAETNYKTVIGPRKSMHMGIPNPVVKPMVELLSDGLVPATETTIKETRVYCYTYVHRFGEILEESGPSPASDQVTLQPDGTVKVVGFAYWGAPPAGCEPYQMVGIRIYRSVVTESDTVWLFVAELKIGDEVLDLENYYSQHFDFTLPLPQPGPNGSVVNGIRIKDSANWVEYRDSLLAKDLGEPISVLDYAPPPDNMIGLVSMPNGFLAGFVENKIYFTPPYQPHAWPPGYAVSVDAQIVGMEVFGQSIVVATIAHPYVCTGTDPSQMTLEKMPLDAPCVSKHSIVSDETGVMYSCPDGIVSVSGNGIQISTRNVVSREEWSQYNPQSMVGGILDGKYYLFYEVGNTKAGLVFDRYSQASPLTTIDFHTHAVWVDTRDANLYLFDNERDTVVVWNTDKGNPLTYKWRSKYFIIPQPVNLGAYDIDANFQQINESQAAIAAANAQIQANLTLMQSNVRGALNATWMNRLSINDSLIRNVNNYTPRSLMFRVYTDQTLVWEQNITDSRIHRLPSGYFSDIWQFEFEGNVDVRQLKIAEVVKELKNL